jgi:squalene synthase HpnC
MQNRAVGHYENFPVASWLCPPAMRPVLQALYHFARYADDVADEGDAPAAQRLATLQALDAGLVALAQQPHTRGLAPPLAGLAQHWQAWRLPLQPLRDLLDAFAQDVRHTAHGLRYADDAALLAYCARSANPVGRLVLHLAGMHEPPALAQSDAICTGLQLINFWQDLSVDGPRGRFYVPQSRWLQVGLPGDTDPAQAPPAQARAVITALVAEARGHLLRGAPLARRVPGRLGLELHAVVAGGLRVCDRVQRMSPAPWQQRVVLGWRDAPALALGMGKLVWRGYTGAT